MRIEDFPAIEIDQPGLFRVVADDVLRTALNVDHWVAALQIPASGLKALGFAIRYFRIQKDLSLRQLAAQSRINRDRISEAEDGTGKRGPHPETLGQLASVLGADFKSVARGLGYEVKDPGDANVQL